MSQCDHLQRYLDGSLSSDDAHCFDRHLHTCRTCSANVKDWELTRAVLQSDFELTESAPSEALVARLLETAAEEGDTPVFPLRHGRLRRTVRGGRFIAAGIAAAAIIVGLAAAIALKPERTATPGVAPAPTTPPPRAVTAPTPQKAREMADGRDMSTPTRDGTPLPHGMNRFERHKLWVPNDSDLRDLSGTGNRLALRTGTVNVATETGASPVTILAGPYVIRDIGTTFQVRYDPGVRLEVTVAEGMVSVEGTGELPIRVSPAQAIIVQEKDAYVALEDRDATAVHELIARSFNDTMDTDGETAMRPDIEETAPRTPVPSVVTATPPVPSVVTATPERNIKRWRRMVVQGDLSPAEEEISRYLQHHKVDPRAWSILGDCRRKAGRWRGAITAYEATARHGSPADIQRATYLRGEILQDKLHDHDGALTAFRRFLAHTGDTRLRGAVQLRVAKSELALGRRAAALKTLDGILGSNVDDALKAQARTLRAACR